jgi:hypothetical protein
MIWTVSVSVVPDVSRARAYPIAPEPVDSSLFVALQAQAVMFEAAWTV